MITHSIKVSIAAAVVLLASFVAVTPAFADINLQDFGFKVNGNTNDTIQPGDNFEVTVNVDVNSGDEVEYFRIRLLDTDNNIVSTDCQSVGRVRDVNDKDIRFNTETPNDIPNGQYDVQLLPFGIAGEAQSNGCDLDNDFPGDQETYQNRLFVDDDEDVFGNSGSSSGGSNFGSLSYFQQLVADLTKQVGCLVSGQGWDASSKQCVAKPVLAGPSCTSLWSSAALGTHALQTWLWSNVNPSTGMTFMTGAQVATGPGTYGPKTTAAHAVAMAVCVK